MGFVSFSEWMYLKEAGDKLVKCQWCGKDRPDSPGICSHCHRFPTKYQKNTKLDKNEQAGDATMMASGKDGYDQNLQRPEGLAYRKPEIPNHQTRMSKKLDKLFGKRRTDGLAPNR